MQLGIFAKTFEGHDPATVLAAAGAAGFATVQYNMACSGLTSMPDAIDVKDAADVATAARVSGIRIAAVSGTYNMIHPDVRLRHQGHARLEVLARNCAAMGVSLITLCTGTRDPQDQWRAHPGNASKEAWHDLRQAMEIALGIAERHNVDLGVEPELANVVSSAAKTKQLIDEMQSARLKVVLDPANLFEHETVDEQRHIVSEAIDLLAGHIVMGHAKDRKTNGEFTITGQGCLDFTHYLSGLKAIGFFGPLITHGLTAAEAPGVARHLRWVLASVGIAAV